jgi:hypothetical protein
MLTYFKGQKRVVQVMDFTGAQMITFTMDELESEEMPTELKKYIKTIEKDINERRCDYERPAKMQKYRPNF